MIKTKETYFTIDEVCKDLAFTSYEMEMKKQSDLFYILYYWMAIENELVPVEIIYDEKFRYLYLHHPVMRYLVWKYFGLKSLSDLHT